MSIAIVAAVLRRFEMQNNVTATTAHKGDNYYIVIYHYVKGKRKAKWIKTDLTVSGHNKRKLEKLRLEKLREYTVKYSLNDSEMLFSDYLKKWIEESKHTISQSTYYSYRATIQNVICPYFEEKRILLCDLKPFQINDFYNYKMDNDNVTANTIHHYHANISKALNDAVDSERISTNPARRVKLPKKEKHIADFYSLDELKTLLEYVKGEDMEIVVLLAAWFGLRRGEIAGVRWSAIDFDSKTLYITGTVKDKGESGSKIENLRFEPKAKTDTSIRAFPMSDKCVDFLKAHKAKIEKHRAYYNKAYNHKWDDFVCVRKNGDLIPLEYISRKFPELCIKAGLKRLKLHELRHTNISILLEQGADMKRLQEWAGHSNYNTTANIYSHLKTDSKVELMQSLQAIL